MAGKFIPLKDLEVYQLARELSRLAWNIYEELDWRDKKLMGDQFVEASDSVGANIAEGYFRYHFLERIKFYYNARASLAEAADHWFEILRERKKVQDKQYENFKEISQKLSIKLNNFIASTHKAKTTNLNKSL